MNPAEFAAIDRLLIDGNNLLHRVSGSVGPGALRGLLARLGGAIPAHVPTIVMLDAHSAPGPGRSPKVAPSLEIRHSGSWSAAATLVSDDRALRDKAMSRGAHTQRLQWLETLMNPSGASVGIGRKGIRPPNPPAAEESERAPWQPGRGATKKRGNPKRMGR